MSDHHVFLCPACGKGSTSYADAEDGYCGICHAQTGIPVRITVGNITGIVGHLDSQSPEPVGLRLTELLHNLGEAFEAFVATLDRVYGTFHADRSP